MTVALPYTLVDASDVVSHARASYRAATARRDELCHEARMVHGMSLAEIGRLTGLERRHVARAIRRHQAKQP